MLRTRLHINHFAVRQTECKAGSTANFVVGLTKEMLWEFIKTIQKLVTYFFFLEKFSLIACEKWVKYDTYLEYFLTGSVKKQQSFPTKERSSDA